MLIYAHAFFLTRWHMPIMLNYVHKSQRRSGALKVTLNTQVCKMYFGGAGGGIM